MTAPSRSAIIRRSPWGYSSAGRALAWHARGQRFDPAYLHHSDIRAASRAALLQTGSPSSRGLGHRPFTAVTGVRIPLGTLSKSRHCRHYLELLLARYRIVTVACCGNPAAAV